MEISGGVKAHLILPRKIHVDVPVQLDRRLLGRIRYHGHGLLFAHDAVVVAGVGDEEVALAVGPVARDEALGFAEARGRVPGGDEVVGCGCHFGIGVVEARMERVGFERMLVIWMARLRRDF